MSASGGEPKWAQELREHYLDGGSSFFILHGNTDDVYGVAEEGQFFVETITGHLGRSVFGQYELVLHYDIGRGLRLAPGGDKQREEDMRRLLAQYWRGPVKPPLNPLQVLRHLDQVVTKIMNHDSPEDAPSLALLFDYGELLCPHSSTNSGELAVLLNWARNPAFKLFNICTVFLTSSLSLVHPSLVQSGYTTEITAAMPCYDDRHQFIAKAFDTPQDKVTRVAQLGAGLSLANLDSLLRQIGRAPRGREDETMVIWPGHDSEAKAQPRRIGNISNPKRTSRDKQDDSQILALKKKLIEAQCPGLIEFISPQLSLKLVAGHIAARKRLTQDAELISSGHLHAVPMGYLICGPVGVGKTFMALCYAGDVGIPCLLIKNFRGKYVGETEANLEKILEVLRELGPVAVIIDEADAAVGNRSQAGDSGTSQRAFAQLASQMGNTAYRGKTIWFLLTCRPDLLPVDLKRQGRCEEHIPLFYPQNINEQEDMFFAMAKKLGLKLDSDSLPTLSEERSLSGADIESLLTRARREMVLTGEELSQDLLNRVLAQFHSPRGPEHEMQTLASVLECSDLRYLPDDLRKRFETPSGRQEISSRFRRLKIALNE